MNESFKNEIEYYRKIDREFDRVIHHCFPNTFVQGHANSGNRFQADITKYNQGFSETEYFYNGKLEFFHLTSIQNLLSILNERSFRFYNLHNSNDEKEYKHIAELFRMDEDEINHKKEYLYTFSFCPMSEIENDKVWMEYGRNYSGAAIVFTIENDPLQWENYHMAEMKYGLSDKFKKYFQLKRDFEKKYNISAECDLSKLIAFHKEPHWLLEKEIRLLTYYPFSDINGYLKYSKPEFRLTEGRNRIVHYINLPLWVDNDAWVLKDSNSHELRRTQELPEDYFITRPKIKIKDILIGKNAGIDSNKLGRFSTTLKNIIFYNYGYDIKITNDLFSC
ncbi:MAG: DUF2971 domain-containing protein [Cyclobacteriaceae bacterium]|nr:DUF2971 domain-containing protein [Cyclobacteriaceae bacterium]